MKPPKLSGIPKATAISSAKIRSELVLNPTPRLSRHSSVGLSEGHELDTDRNIINLPPMTERQPY